MPVYVDVLLIVNGFINYLMLFLSMRYLNIRAQRLRLLLACSLGSVFSLRIFLPDIPLLPELLLRAVMCCAISAAAFGFGGRRTFLRNTCVFFTVNLLFGGLMSAVFYFFGTKVILYRNGTAYFDIDLKILAVTSVASFAAVNAVSLIISRKAPKESICAVSVSFGERKVSGRGFFDTGNALREIFSGFPVIVAHYDAVKSILPDEIIRYCRNEAEGEAAGKIRLIPFSGAGSAGVLPAFRPDSVTLKTVNGEKIIKDVYIAVSRQSFFGGEFEFLLNNELTGDDNHERNEKNTNTAHKAHGQKQHLLHKRPRNSAAAPYKA